MTTQAKDPWSPNQYNKFEKQRDIPFYDLLKLVIPNEGMSIVDLGCGTGKLTKVLHDKLLAKKTLGIDSSSEMLRESVQCSAPKLDFALMDMREYKPDEKVDLIFSNAAMQWVPDHFTLITRLSEFLAKNGQLAIQIPANNESPTHVIASELGRQSPYKEHLNGLGAHPFVLPIEEYSKLLYDLGFKEQIVRMQVYPHVLESVESVIEWVKGSLMTYYRSQLPKELYDSFLSQYSERVHQFFGEKKPLFYPFKRILIWGQK
jgi:trans-aconitate 2-methyltransferase